MKSNNNLTHINHKYEQLCAKIGDLEVKIRMYNKELERLHAEVLSLNEAAAVINSVEAEKAKTLNELKNTRG